MNAPDMPAETWRDLADQLTPEQIARLEVAEVHYVPMADGTVDVERDRQGCLLFGARELAAQNLAAMLYQHVPAPESATDVGPWEKFDDGPGWSRLWWGNRRLVCVAGAGTHDFSVLVQGAQWSDGRLQRGVVLDSDDSAMSAAEVRKLAAALVAAADELDALNAGVELAEVVR